MSANQKAASGQAKDSTQEEEPQSSRDEWDNPVQFLLSCIGYSVGLGNVWRFPYLCYKHGGAAFVLVYLFLQLTIGKPLYFMELALGQYSRKAAVHVWDMVPGLRGIGLSMCLVSLHISLYYNVIMVYVLYFFFAAFFPTLPWNVCEPEWKDCYTKMSEIKALPICKKPIHESRSNCTCSGNDDIDTFYPNCSAQLKPSAAFFFDKIVANISDNIMDFGVPSWKLMLLLILSWVIVLLCLVKGIKSSGVVVYFTATFPYVVLLIMLVRGILLDGAGLGIKLFIFPKWSSIGSKQLWIDAAGQMFFSLSLSMGGIIMYGSYNKFKHPIYRDAVIISTMDLVTSVLAGFVVFPTLGYMAKATGRDVDKVVSSGFALAFKTYPETLSTLAAPNFWSLLFFFMLYTLGLDSQFALMETVLSFVLDDFLWCRRHMVGVRVGLCVSLCLLGLPIICPGGIYLITVLDQWGSGYLLPVIALMETVSVMWIYGINRLLNDLKYMLGHKPRLLPYWYFVWMIWSPLLLFTLAFTIMISVETPSYADGTKFGPGMMTFCWILFGYTIIPVPVWFLLYLRAVSRKRGPFPTWKEYFKVALQPSDKWGPNDGNHPECRCRKETVFAEILDWKIFQGPVGDPGPPSPTTSSVPPPATTSVTTPTDEPINPQISPVQQPAGNTSDETGTSAMPPVGTP